MMDREPEYTDPIDTPVINLDRLQFATKRHIPHAVRNSHVDIVEETIQGIIIQMAATVMSHRIEPSTVEILIPISQNWWQRFKTKYPNFTAKPARPVVESVMISLEHYVTFPDCKIEFPPDLGRPVQLALYKGFDLKYYGDEK